MCHYSVELAWTVVAGSLRGSPGGSRPRRWQREVRKPSSQRLPRAPYPESDPARMERLNQLILELETLRTGIVRVVDLAGYMRTLPDGEMDPNYRPDGTHFTLEGAGRIWTEWLGTEIVRIYREHQADETRGEELNLSGGQREQEGG